jgi:tetratricopeptide (TPR) repeat protein
MKSHTISTIRCLGMAGLVLAFGIFAFGALAPRCATAQSQNSVSFGHTDFAHHADGRQPDNQQPSATAASELTVITPELRADVLAAHGQYQQAIEAYDRIRPQTPELYNKLGIAYQHLGMDDDAIGYYNLAAKLDHRLAAAYNNLGTVYFHENDNKRAQRLYKKSIHLDEKTAPFWSNLGAAYLAQRQYSDGAEAYERAFNLDPDIFQDLALNGIQQSESPEELARMYLTFAEIYAHAGMKTQAIDYLRKALLEGLRDAQKLQQDQQLATLHGTPEFEQLLASQHKP